MNKLYYLINGIDVSDEAHSLNIVDRVTTNPDSCYFEMDNPANHPVPGNSVQIYLNDVSNTLFAGTITSTIMQTLAPGHIYNWRCVCSDYRRLFDRRLVAETYRASDKTVNEIVDDIVTNYTSGFTDNNVDIPYTLLKPIVFNYRYPSDCLREMAELLGAVWWIDKNRDVHFIENSVAPNSPINVTDSTLSSDLFGFSITCDYSQIRNQVFVQGGWKTSSVTIERLADGSARFWNLPYKPHNLVVKVDEVLQTLGQENVDVDDGTYEYMYNYYDKVVKCGSAEPTPAANSVMKFEMDYEIPVLARVNNIASQTLIASAEGGDGIYEYILRDNNIEDTDMAVRRARLELTKHSYPKVRGSFYTHYSGFESGQRIQVDVAGNEYNDWYNISQVEITCEGNNVLLYNVEFEGNYDG